MHIEDLAARICHQADRLFPNRTDQSMFLKLYHELGELISADTPTKRSDELADVMILILDYAHRHDIHVSAAVEAKMAINDERKWKINEMGVAQHV